MLQRVRGRVLEVIKVVVSGIRPSMFANIVRLLISHRDWKIVALFPLMIVFQSDHSQIFMNNISML